MFKSEQRAASLMARAQGTLVILANGRQVNALLHTNTL
jgi:hypothetical protein